MTTGTNLQSGCFARLTVGHLLSQEACRLPDSPRTPNPPSDGHTHTQTHTPHSITTCGFVDMHSEAVGLTCLSSFSIADITINPRHTIGATSSTRNPIDILTEGEGRSKRGRELQLHLASAPSTKAKSYGKFGVLSFDSPRDSVVGEGDHQIVWKEEKRKYSV